MAELLWDNATFIWDSSLHTWDYVVQQIEGGKSKWKGDKDKRKRKEVIKLVMWRKGIKVYDEAKEIENIELYIDDIKLIAEEIKKNVQIIHG
jgi:hypothetical protein